MIWNIYTKMEDPTGIDSANDLGPIGPTGPTGESGPSPQVGPVYVPDEYIPHENLRSGVYAIYKQPINTQQFDVRVNTQNTSICGILCKFVSANGTPIVMDSRNSTLEILSQNSQTQVRPAIAKPYYTYVQQYSNGIQQNPDLWTYYFGETLADLTLRFSIQYSTSEPIVLYVYTFIRQTFPGELLFGNYIIERIHNESFMGIETQVEPYLLWMVSK